MAGIQYSDLVTQLTDLLEYPLVSSSSSTPSSDPNFNNILPAIINDAEQRIYREVDFLNNREENSTLPVTVDSRNFTVPVEIIVVESLALIVPDGVDPQVGERIYFLRTSIDALNMTWPQASVVSPPIQYQSYYAMLTNTQAILAPTPDQAYQAEITGIFRPAAMSSTNTTTYLGTNFPDLFLAACMVFGTGFQRDFGAQSENPQASNSWEAVYQARLKSVLDEESRRRGLRPEGP